VCDKLLFKRLKQDQSTDVLDAFLSDDVLSSLYLPSPLPQGFFVSVFYCFLNSEVSRFTLAYRFNNLTLSPPTDSDVYSYFPSSGASTPPFGGC